MKTDKLKYLLHSGKNSKLKYFALNYVRMLLPHSLYASRLAKVLAGAERRKDIEYMRGRVDYYCKLDKIVCLPENAASLSGHKKPRHKSVYYFDTVEYTRWYPGHLRWAFCPGDVTYVPDVPSIVKSRPIAGDNANSVLMKLNKVRHFIFVDDRKTFREKKPMAIFRGKCHSNELRVRFMEKYYGHPLVDAGDVCRHPQREEWRVSKMTIPEHLDYRYVISIEGNDVATNVKWVMSGHSLLIMPRPRYETWFMEGLLQAGVHYVEVKDDFSDLVDKIEYYNSHPQEAEVIIRNANEYVSQFRDSKREKLISLMVLEKYFKKTGQ